MIRPAIEKKEGPRACGAPKDGQEGEKGVVFRYRSGSVDFSQAITMSVTQLAKTETPHGSTCGAQPMLEQSFGMALCLQ